VTLAGVPRKILFVDLDNTLVDFPSRIEGLDPTIVDKYEGRLDEAPGIFALMRPLPGAIGPPFISPPATGIRPELPGSIGG
jgi:hypothetical protein